jgi:hypothetical protein
LRNGLAGECLERGRACLLGVEREPTFVERLQVERLATGKSGIVGGRDELAADAGAAPAGEKYVARRA